MWELTFPVVRPKAGKLKLPSPGESVRQMGQGRGEPLQKVKKVDETEAFWNKDIFLPPGIKERTLGMRK